MEMAGVDNVIRMAHKMGITTLDRGLDYYGLALTLGGGEVKLLDETYAFGVLANRGNMAGAPIPEDRQRPGYRTVDPVPVLRVEDSDGNVLWKYDTPTTIPVVDEKYAYIINEFPVRQSGALAGVWPQQRAGTRSAGRGQDRDDQRLQRQLDGRVYAASRHRRVDRQHRQQRDEEGHGHHGRRAGVESIDDVLLERQAGRAVCAARRVWWRKPSAPPPACCRRSTVRR